MIRAAAALAIFAGAIGATDAFEPRPVPAPITIVAFGDSTTAGTPGWRSPIEAPPSGSGDEHSQYAYWLHRAHPDWNVLNRGVNGERTDEILARFDRDVRAARPRIVIVIAGVNDVYQGRAEEDVRAHLEGIYAAARASGIRVLAGSILPYNSATPGQNAAMHRINAWIAAVPLRDANVAFVDTRAAVAATGSPDELSSSPDGLHPSVDGYHHMADAIGAALTRIGE